MSKLKSVKVAREFDWSKARGRKIALKVSYLGQDYYGFTGNSLDYSGNPSETLPTIEKELFRALMICKLIPSPDACGWARAGRTDKGVSGFGQVVSLWIRTKLSADNGSLDWDAIKSITPPGRKTDSALEAGGGGSSNHFAGQMEEYGYMEMLNRLLPAEIRVLAWSPVEAEFDARFSCLWRKYKYFFPTRNLKMDDMKKAAELFIGKHDCRFICKLDPTKAQGPNYFIRDVYESKIEKIDDDFSVFLVRGKAFLWHQVRNMMSLLFMVGEGHEQPDIITTMLTPSLHSKGGKPNYLMAPDSPLVLIECGYQGLDWRLTDIDSQHSDKRTLDILQEQWTVTALKLKQLESLRDEFKMLGADSTLVVPSREKKHVGLMKRLRANSVETIVGKLKASKKAKKNDSKRMDED